MIRKEIFDYDKKVSQKKEIIILSKCDLVDDKIIQKGLTCFKKFTRSKLFTYRVIKI